MPQELKGTTPFADLPIHKDRKRTYIEAEVLPRVRAWASSDGSGDKDKIDWANFSKAFLWRDPGNPENFEGYKLKFADVVDGKLVAVARGVFLAAAVMQGARGGVNIPDADRDGVRSHIGRYYAKMRKVFEDETIVEPWKSKALDPLGGEVRPAMEFKSFPAEFKVDAEQRLVDSYVSVFGNVDEGGDVVDRGAFTKTLREFGHRVKACYQHEWWEPIGKPTVMEEDAKGLHTQARISRTRRGDDVMILIQDGVINETSFGYNPIKWSMDEEQQIRHLEEVRLFEFSYVTWGMNELATITGVKVGDLGLALKRFAAFHAEMKEGRVLSSRNREHLQKAIAALQALLDAADAETDPAKTSPLGDALEGAAGGDEAEAKVLVSDLTAWFTEQRTIQEMSRIAREMRSG